MIFIETILNQVLFLDAQAPRHLKKLEGKSIEIKIDLYNTKKRFLFLFSEKGIQLTNDHPANVMMDGPLKAFLNLALTKNPYTAAQLGLSFEGETETLETIQQLFFSLDIDWEEYISQWTGDILAHQMGRLARFAKKRQRELSQSAQESTAEYLKEELKILPTHTEVEYFLNAVDILRADVERLAMRMEQLK